MTTVNASASALRDFDTTTARWGRLTMIAGLAFSLAGPAYLVFFSGLEADPAKVLTALLAIGGAAMVHLVSLLILVGFLGTWLVSVVPPEVVAVVRTYILPSVLGAVLVQAVVSTRNLRVTVIAAEVAATVVFLLVPAAPALAFFGTAIAVIVTAVLAWFLRDRSASAVPAEPGPADEPARD